jgi:ABC-type multidrug transport system ATPase subunit
VSDILVQVDHVHKVIRGQEIIHDLNLRVRRGRIVALCGGNGAGKSTVLRMLAGIIRPTTGSITIGGLRWETHRRQYAEQIGYMPDDYRFTQGLTALETMAFWAGLKGLPKSRAREALAEVGLDHTGKKPVTSFSKGMRQRMLFAQAMLAKPPLVLMDEPTNGLDPFWMDTFVRLVRDAADAGQTFVFSTHQWQIADALADDMVFLQNGRVELEGTAEDIRSRLGSTGLHDVFAKWFGIARARG